VLCGVTQTPTRVQANTSFEHRTPALPQYAACVLCQEFCRGIQLCLVGDGQSRPPTPRLDRHLFGEVHIIGQGQASLG